MNSLKKMIAMLVAVAMLATFVVPAFAADGFTYETQAKNLYDLGLYKGTDSTTYVPNLGGKLDRQTGVVMLLRLFGQEEDALALTTEDAAAKLASFTDAATIADWAQKQVAYAVNKGYVKGYPDGTFKPAADLNGKAYSSLILQQLGYDGDFDYATAALYLKEVGGLNAAEGGLFNADSGINRDALVGISSGSMKAKYKGSELTVAEKLVDLGKIDKDKAIALEYMFKVVKEVAELEEVRVIIGGTPVFADKVKVTYEDDTTEEATITWPTVDTTAAGEQEIQGKIAKTLAVAKVKLIVEEDKLKATKITSSNLKEIVVEFNKAVEEKSAESKGNYELDEEALKTDDKVELNDDGKSVTITFDIALDNHNDIELVIEGVKDASGKEMEEKSTLKAKISDTKFPEVKEIVLTGPDTFKLIFSEPIDCSEGGDVEFDDDVYSVSFDEESAGNEVICTLGTDDIDEGDYEVKVENFEDFAGYMIADKTFTLKYAIDKSDIKAEIKEAKQEKVVIKFNKGVKDEDGNPLSREFFYHTFDKNMPDDSTDGVTYNDDFTEYTLLFEDEPLHEGTVKIVVKDEAEVDDEDISVEDVWGNELKNDLVLSATISADSTKPTISDIDCDDDEKEIKIYFSESVNDEDAEDDDNYKFTDSDGDEVTPDDIDYTNDTANEDYYVTVTFDDDLSGDYTVEIKNIKDTSLSENVMDTVTRKFNVKDISAIDVDDVKVWAVDGTSDDFIYVYFPEDMDTKSVLDLDNYMIDDDGVIEALDDDDDEIEIFRGDKSKIKITIDDATKYVVESGDLEIQIGKVKDEAGNAIDRLSFTKTILADVAPVVLEAKTIDSNKIEIKLDKIITSINKDGFEAVRTVTGSTYSDDVAKYSYEVNSDDSETTITLTLKSTQKLNDPSDNAIKINIVEDDAIKTETGKYLQLQTINVADGWGPGLDEDEMDKEVTTQEFVLVFDEDVVASVSNLALFATELKIVDKDGDKLKASTEYSLELDGNEITVTLKGDDYDDYEGKLKVTLEDNSDYAKDAAGNGVKKFDTVTIEIDD